MNLTKTANVTARDIKLGTPADPCACPLARAVKRLFHTRGSVTVSVGRESLCVTEWPLGEWPKKYIFDHDAHRFTRDFDNQDPVEPCKVKLTLKTTITENSFG